MSSVGLCIKTGPLNGISYHLTRGFQIVILPRSTASVAKLIRMPYDGILHRCEWPDLIKLSKEAANSVTYLTLVSTVISLAPSICTMKLTLDQPIFKRFCLHCGLSITAALESTRKELLLQRIYILLVATADNYIIHTNVTTADSMLLLW